jgi:hypothetical protein
MDQPFPERSEAKMLVEVPMQVMGLSIAYSAALGWLERRFPNIKPDHIWAEVAGGVLVSLVPVALAARQINEHAPPDQHLSWQTYEGAVWRAFFASGTPIILWQLGEAVTRHMELMKYTTYAERRSVEIDAHSTTALADGSGERARTNPADVDESDAISSGSAGES